MIASTGQMFLQTPHLIQADVSILCNCFIEPEIQSTGQLVAHFVQPMQSSVISK